MRKRYWRIVAAKEYIEWRNHGRPITIAANPWFNANAAIKAFRLRQATDNYDIEWVSMSRIWQIKARINYGRY